MQDQIQDLPPEIVNQLKEGPEQRLVVGPLVEYLCSKGYKLEQIRFGKKEWSLPQNPSEAARREKGEKYRGYPVDIAIFDSPQTTGSSCPRIIIEAKQPGEKAGVAQLQAYLSLEHSLRLGIWTSTADPSATVPFLYAGEECLRRRPITDIPAPGAPLAPDLVPLRYRDITVPSREILRKLFPISWIAWLPKTQTRFAPTTA